jgi:death-on-curing family protein
MKRNEASQGDIVFYQAPDGAVRLDVRLEQDTLWLTQKQMALLFDKDTDTIGLHLKNIFDEGELVESATTEGSSVVQIEGNRSIRRKVRIYSLDAIISVGYRVNSKRGTQFRIWATQIIKDHILKGYSVNEKRLKELNRAIRLITDTVERRDLSTDESKALLRVVGQYNRALNHLDDYDHKRVSKPAVLRKAIYALDYEEALRIVKSLKKRFVESNLFGVEKDKGLASALGAIMQTFDGKELYPSIEEKAANLLYFLVKNHAFVDGNKRIAAALFLWFLERNCFLVNRTDERIISDAALVAITLMIAESQPQEKDILVSIVSHLLSEGDEP